MAEITSASDGHVLVIRFTASRMLDEAKIRQIGDELLALVDKTEEERVLVDFQGVDFMSSAMLGRLIRLHKKCKEYKVKLKMCHIDPEILQVFKMTQLHKIFDIHADRAAALESFGKRGRFF